MNNEAEKSQVRGKPCEGRLVQAAPGVRSAVVLSLIGQVTPSELRTKVEALAALHTRYSEMPHLEPALNLVEGWLQAAGCMTWRQPVPMGRGRHTVNLVAERRGTSDAPRLFIVCAHLDSLNSAGDSNARAPGANDNASGCASLVAMAHMLLNQRLLHDVRFILFGGEEQGRLGSKHYVDGLGREDRERISGVVNLDMVANLKTSRPSVIFEGDDVSQGVMDALVRAAATYTSLQTYVSLCSTSSDHASFIRERLPAVGAFEGQGDVSEDQRHRESDTPERLDFLLHREITVSVLVWLAEQVLGLEGRSVPGRIGRTTP
ncbi:Zn-dependent exopeptidase M28 [Corallococcus exiguus]|nr:Zn-dependent exopeptidase M28 [Corallococcus exiguus]NNC02307.1 Zn-dependent exopeptidase M28 [Corallococcus exiguus]